MYAREVSWLLLSVRTCRKFFVQGNVERLLWRWAIMGAAMDIVVVDSAFGCPLVTPVGWGEFLIPRAREIRILKLPSPWTR